MRLAVHTKPRLDYSKDAGERFVGSTEFIPRRFLSQFDHVAELFGCYNFCSVLL